ncbi:MAG: HAMP domain-containing protein [Cryobacterium sp.]|nr:HAMP domain-containing protein [Micrococcales bacterium]MBX3308982.1 HAMP domain-containing protein [Cryobacterium sp.]
MRGKQHPAAGFGPKLLMAQGLVILAGGVTLLAVALWLAPGLFSAHIDQTVGPIPENLERHLQIAFARATLTSLLIGILVATLTGLAVSWYVTRRVVDPIKAMAQAASDIADGHYAARVTKSGLGIEFDVVGHAFNRMARELAATERTRAEILRDLAHELRTPLTTIRGYHEALADGVMVADQETYTLIEAELSRVERLVGDIARVSVIEERQYDLRLKRVGVQDILTIANASAARSFQEHGVTLTCDASHDCDVMADPDRLQEALANLLENALRHTAAGGQVTLSAECSNDTAHLTVTDTGEGIAAEHLPRVFERFYRVDSSRSRSRGGSGIGLAITRALVEAHGGRITAHSAGFGAGSSFTITLPTEPKRT